MDPELQDFNIVIPFEKSVSSTGELKLFGGIASSSAVDRDFERIDKAVLPKIASDLRKNSTVFFNHDTKGLGVGTVANAEVRGDEVYVDVVPTKAAGMQDVVTQIKEGILKSFSIGGKIVDWENQYDDKLGKNVRVIKDVECYEVSVVGVPSNKEASILSYITKSFKGGNVAEPIKGPGETLGKEPGQPSPGQVLSKGENDVMVKCAKCGTENHVLVKVADEKPETAQGPHEDGKKSVDILDSPEFKKLFDGFKSEVDVKYSDLKKSYEDKIAGFEKNAAEAELKLNAANARIEELHKSFDAKSKALESGEQAIEGTKTETVKKESKETFGVFPAGKAF
jgi:HK97 family phage prohead protease